MKMTHLPANKAGQVGIYEYETNTVIVQYTDIHSNEYVKTFSPSHPNRSTLSSPIILSGKYLYDCSNYDKVLKMDCGTTLHLDYIVSSKIITEVKLIVKYLHIIPLKGDCEWVRLEAIPKQRVEIVL